MKTNSLPFGRWCFVVMIYGCCDGYSYSHNSLYVKSSKSSMLRRRQFVTSCHPPIISFRRRHSGCRLEVSTVDVDVSDKYEGRKQRNKSDGTILSWDDISQLSMYAAACLVGAIIISTYEDYDVTHTRPSPSTLRLPTSITSSKFTSSWARNFNFIGAATKGMGWGQSDRGVPNATANYEPNHNDGHYSFEEWYGSSAITLQWKPSYNEVMLQHRLERVPRWNEPTLLPPSAAETRNSVDATNEQMKQAVLQLYHAVDELEILKSMADDYMWDDIKEHLNPTSNTHASKPTSEYPLPLALEYSMDVLKSLPSNVAMGNNRISPYSKNNNLNELPKVIGFDWGSCAWRHCGAKADAQEAIAELYSDVGMLEPFECRFILGECEFISPGLAWQ